MARRQQRPAERRLPEISYGQSADMRRQFMEEYYRPIAQRMLEREARLDAVMVAFAQYWNDEADDAVHCRLIPLADRQLTLEEAFTQKNHPFLAVREWDDRSQKMIPHPDRVDPWNLVSEARTELFGQPGHWDNDELITAFASFTKEGCDQGMSTEEAYLPYAIFVRLGDGVACHTVGEMLRPHLENQPPSSHRDE